LAIEQLHTCRPILAFVGALTAEPTPAGGFKHAVTNGTGSTPNGSAGSGASGGSGNARTTLLPHLTLTP
jgi:hypothetical protein